jgi:hypothetical protein
MAEEAGDRNISGLDGEYEQGPVAKKARRMVLDEDEEEMASALPSLEKTNDTNTDPAIEDEEEMGPESDASQDINGQVGDWGSLMDNSVRFKLLLLLFF